MDLSGQGRIVGIGASAGGLESLEQLFSNLPSDTGLAFVVVQHLSPDFRSLMDELIARHSTMPVRLADDGMLVEPNHIYLMPPRKEMIIRERHLWLADKEPHTFSLPIDSFFRSLAQDIGAQAIAIVLSGSGSDGSRGIVDVKRFGGVVMAESATSAKFDGMPLAAAATGKVDHTHTPADLARVLCGLAPTEVVEEMTPLSDDPAMDAVLRLLRDNFGIDFSLYKITTVGRRIQRRIELLHLGGLPEYVDQLLVEPEELNKLYQDLLIGVTQFFRDPDAYDSLEREVIPKLLEQVKPEDELRVWIAGCATGEEAYSLAMLFLEAFEAQGRPLNLKILATDVHQRSLDYASAAIYGDEQLARVSARRLERFFARRPGGYQVCAELRQLIVFARHNVTKDPPFTRMNFISCRNLLIYFQPQAQRSTLSLFHFGLVPNGVLFLGASETPGALSDEFTVLDDHWKIYRKRRDVHLLNHVRLAPLRRTKPLNAPRLAPLDLPRTPSVDPLVLGTYDQLLDMFMPPGLLVDDSGQLIDTFGGAEKLLKVKARRPTNNLLELLNDELRAVIGGAMQRAIRDRSSVSYSGVRMPDDDARRIVTVQPLVHPRTGANNWLITFTVAPGAPAMLAEPAAPAPAPVPMSVASTERMTTLEGELAYTRDTLQATIEELETSNEEMQATNEELVASNEELQSTNEELHSVNEELYTVNAEYHQKIGELKEVNSDMAHLLEGTDVGTVFLDRELRIRRFTTRIASVFHFQNHDVGRRISDFSHNIERPQLMDDIEHVLREGTMLEDEVHDSAGTPYFLRILPYRLQRGGNTDAAPISGVVLTLTDITTLDKARTRIAQLSSIVEWTDDAILALDLHGAITAWNRGAERLYGHAADHAIGKSAAILLDSTRAGDLAELLAKVSRGEKIAEGSALCKRADGTLADVSVTISPIYHRGAVIGASAIARDISPVVAARRALEAEQHKVNGLLQRREEFLAMLSHELRNPLAAIVNAIAMLERDDSVERASRYRGVIKRQASHMKGLLDDLLDVSRITSEKFSLQTHDLDLRDAIETAVESTAPLYEARRIRLEQAIPDQPLHVRGDARRLAQVVANLLANAATYSPTNTTVKLHVEPMRGAYQICVEDQGEGIESELQPKIFDLFVQAEQKLDRPRGGLGVGLSLAKKIVELHDGTIGVHSDGRGKGSRFSVTLPQQDSATAAVAVAAVPTNGKRRHKACRIVLVDDQQDSREMLRDLLESFDHEVYDGADGASAIQLITEHKPDVAFIDIGLPVLNGFEVAQQIRKRPELSAVRLVALSGYGTQNDVQAALAAGFDEHVTKPAAFDTLERVISRARPHS
jgi:two-component system CheB/CheR fusion protein